MSKKIIIFILCSTFGLQAAEHPNTKIKIDDIRQLAPAMEVIKARIIKRPATPYVSTHRSGPRIDGDPDQRKPQEKK